MTTNAATTPAVTAGELSSLPRAAKELLRLERLIREHEAEMRDAIERVPNELRESARNLVHYLAMRRLDLRELQLDLAELGLSSLGRSESCVLATVLATSRRAHEALALRGSRGARRELDRLSAEAAGTLGWPLAKHALHAHTHDILGPKPDDRHVYIMITAPSADVADKGWILEMLRAGMNVLRINCAHEGPEQWLRTVRALAAAKRETSNECRLLMDLAGPKIRTGPVAGGRNVATWKPKRDEVGGVVRPARVVVRKASVASEDEERPSLALSDEAFASVRRGDEIRFRDVRGKKRALVVREIERDALVTEATERAYVEDRAEARLFRGDKRAGGFRLEVRRGASAAIDVKSGDALTLEARSVTGRPPRRDGRGRVVEPGVVSCTWPAALDRLEVGHRVWFDDGRIEARVQAKKDRRYDLVVERTAKEVVMLRAEKGISVPDSVVLVPAITDDDANALAFAVKHADAVGLSFVSRPDDVRDLHARLGRLGARNVGTVLKLETRAGFENLPDILLEAMRWPPLAVMIARGDLAVEVGFERLAELQEEILWLCEAGHVPAVWATQVLDTLARTGIPSRAEVTDAAAGVAAECVMLNKGPFVGEAARVLSDILQRMEKHRFKKRSLFRRLRVSTAANDGGS